jgi:hypothetical protein
MNSTLNSSDVCWLVAHRAQVTEGISRSSPLAPFNRVAADFMAHALSQYEEQMARAGRCRETRTQAIEAGIRAALGVLEIDRFTASIVRRRLEHDPGRYGLDRVPSIKTIRRVVRENKRAF